ARPSARLARPRPKAAALALPLRPDEAQDFVIYTDGSCLRNPDGPGGWAAVIREVATGVVTELHEGSPSTTNNRMELSAAIAALGFPKHPAKVALYTDSQYLKNGITKWMSGWKRRGWKKADGQPVLNQDLWQELDALYSRHDVTFHWVKGHVGVELNERCDRLAKSEAMKYR
ncbi:ribonuclease HI, partial [Mitsuokella multacida]